MLCLKHLDDTEQSQFACFLTRQKIFFYFPKKNVIWIDLRGIDSNILVKLMNYAEVPIPTSNKQGGCSVSLQGANTLSSSHTFHLECKIGRIGAIAVVPVQISVEEVQPLVGEPLERTLLAQALRDKYRAYNFQVVRATNEEGNSCDMIQFLVPQRFESSFPCQCVVNNVAFAIDHALPYTHHLSQSQVVPLRRKPVMTTGTKLHASDSVEKRGEERVPGINQSSTLSPGRYYPRWTWQDQYFL